MTSYWKRCYFLLTLLKNVHICLLHDCEVDFFGKNCEMACRCDTGCFENGDCVNNGPCVNHFFGPACQYADMVTRDSDWHVPAYIIDGNHTTCNDNSTATLVETILRSPSAFTFLRIIVNDPSKASDFVTTLNKGQPCWNEKKYRVDNITVDVTCDNEILLKSLRLEGNVAPHVCTIYINAGRDVTYRRKTWQSSLHNNDTKYRSDYGIDFDDYTCALTNIESTGPEWAVTLDRPARITVINFISHTDRALQFTKGNLFMYDDRDNIVGQHVLNGKQLQYQMKIQSHKLVKRLLLKASHDNVLADRIMSVCMFGAYGDYTCPDKKFGITCEHDCTCNMSEACNYATGICAPGCFAGTYGFNCSQNCSEYCISDTCNYFSGACSPCVYGYFGQKCDEACLPGTFGISSPCKKCSHGCSNVCNTTEGTCRCKERYVGKRCDDCIQGTFGVDLNCVNCSKGCKNICNSANGHCNCLINYAGSRCSECRNGTFGPQCKYVCSKGCTGTCNNVDGHCNCRRNYIGFHCTECRPGRYGTDCQQICSNGCKDICNVTYGSCTCMPGFRGHRCKDCFPGLFGANCTSQCHLGCKGACQMKNGHCNCRKNYEGKLCKVCRQGAFGLDCQYNCSKGCSTQCEKITGNCNCMKYFTGRNCIECVYPRYGRRCDLHCSKNCLNQTCFKTSGKCISCIEDHEGEYCTFVFTSKWTSLSPLPFLMSLMILCVCVCMSRDDDDDSQSEEN